MKIYNEGIALSYLSTRINRKRGNYIIYSDFFRKTKALFKKLVDFAKENGYAVKQNVDCLEFNKEKSVFRFVSKSKADTADKSIWSIELLYDS